MQLSELKAEHLGNYFQTSASYGYYSDRRDAYPSTYLQYARDDQAEGNDARCLVNAIGNAKRAFHLQVEMLCDAYGRRPVCGKTYANFGTYLDFLAKCGVLSPNLLRKLNATRNKVEHDYSAPDSAQVEDYVDIVELFLMATQDLLVRFPESLDYELMKDDDYDESLALPEFISIEIKMTEGGIKLEAGDASLNWTPKDPEYFTWLSAIIRNYVL